MPNEVPVVCHRGSNYDYHFIIKELENEFEREFECLRKNKEKYKTFFVPIKKEFTKLDKDGNESVTTISCKIKFIDSARFMESSLSNLVDNLTEGIHRIKCKDCDCFLEYESVKEILIKYKCLSCNKDYWNKLDKELIKKCKKIFKFSNNRINKSILLFRKGVCPYEYMYDWENFNEITLPKKEESYSNLNLKEITDADYIHWKRVCKEFEIKKLGKYHDLYLESDILLLVDAFEKFRNMCIKVYELDPAELLSALGLA